MGNWCIPRFLVTGWSDRQPVLSMVRVTVAPAVSMSIEAGLAGFLRRHGRHERAGFQLYGAAVSAARDPFLYGTLGVPDTLDGRFDAIGLYVYLVIRRLNADPEPGPTLAQAVFDAMFLDMDINLREMGVGDLSVGKRNRAMWEAFHGRSAAYAAAWGDAAGLEAALARNLWRGAEPPAGSAVAMARLAVAQAACLAGQRLDALLRGDIHFLPAEEAAR
ncbi:MAG: ubiquinol-cytochrome C chaperone family protein [Rhodopila sp.]|nr:ubiquinol-cytochrome C chaperone family protein [Rhodopila sp.]